MASLISSLVECHDLFNSLNHDFVWIDCRVSSPDVLLEPEADLEVTPSSLSPLHRLLPFISEDLVDSLKG